MADQPVERPEATPAEPPEQRHADPLSAMTERFNFFFRWFARRFFRHFDIDPGTVEKLRELESQGSVIYVMRYASRLDYFLFNWLFLREGLRLSDFANGLHYYYYRPVWTALRIVFTSWRQKRHVLREGSHQDQLLTVSKLVGKGRSLFLFLRTERLRSRLLGRRRAVRKRQSEFDFLRQAVDSVWTDERPVFVVPLALFWRKGPRGQRRFLNLAYGSATRPSDFAKISSFLTTYRSLYVKVGDPIELHSFVDERRAEGVDSIARKVRRSLMIFLYREEKAVVGPTLRPRQRVQETVLSEPAVQAAISQQARDKDASLESTQVEAERIFREIAASMNSTFLAMLNVVVTPIIRRLFAGVEASGIEKVAEYAKHHPLVLVPSHRSYFDFVILTWMFYHQHLMPPHIAARENMGFGPFGYLFRRAGAFYLRRSFDDPLYKEIFRQYVAYLVREGFTQEFFIEGGRSRTGKMLTPRLGMLSWDVEAFLETPRRDLLFVPVAITYERLVEEGAMIDEQEGGEKVQESTLGLLRARKFLKSRFGQAFVNFGEPISLAAQLGNRRKELAATDAAAERRVFVERLGNRICEGINWATVANATSVAACALLGETRRGLFRHELTNRMQELVDLLRLQDVKFTPALLHDEGEFQDSIAFLLRSDLLKSQEDSRGEILYFDESRRRALELYRNSTLHFLVAPSFLARRLLRGGTLAELRSDLASWLELFYREFFVPQAEVMAVRFEAFIDYFERFGMIARDGDVLRASEKGHAYFRFLAEQTRGVLEAYFASFAAAAELAEPTGRKQLAKLAEEQFQRSRLLGELKRPEAANPITFANAFDLLLRRGILQPVEAPEGRESRRDEKLVGPGPAFDELPALRELLAGALAAR